MNLIFLGAPGAGKGTQAELVCDRFGIPAVSTGNIIREALKNGTSLGLKAKSFIDSGALVPDDVVIGIIRERLIESDCENGFVLDGFPRTVPQAEALDEMGVTIDKVIVIEVPDEKIEQRLSGRRVCPDCGSSYHIIYKKPMVDGICTKCSSPLVCRKDDEPETVRERLNVYHEQTKPLIDYYRQKGKLHTVIGQEDVRDTTSLTFEVLGEKWNSNDCS